MAGVSILEPSQTQEYFFWRQNFLTKSQTQPLCRIRLEKNLVGVYELNRQYLVIHSHQHDNRNYLLTRW
jgi:hypothetical protein